MTQEPTTGAADGRPQTVAELLARIDREREGLEQAVAGMSDDAFVATSGCWSAKDHVAHVAAWERRLIGEVRGDAAAARFGLDEAAFGAANGDVLNAMLLARHQVKAPDAVRTEFRAAGEALRATFAELSDADLMRPVRPADPAVETLVDLIAWDIFRHYPEHVAAIIGHA